jgi:hypothetical protein
MQGLRYSVLYLLTCTLGMHVGTRASRTKGPVAAALAGIDRVGTLSSLVIELSGFCVSLCEERLISGFPYACGMHRTE